MIMCFSRKRVSWKIHKIATTFYDFVTSKLYLPRRQVVSCDIHVFDILSEKINIYNYDG